jgi:putative Mg2+ transporter-C (MgtC) family protein
MDAVAVPGSFVDLLGRLLLATLFGALIGLNRERERKPAGLRTHALVALGTATLTSVGLLLQSSDASAPSRVLQGVIAGVGFIGAGVILHRQDGRGVHGLTTAAAIWIAAAIGVAAGAGLWRTAASVVGVALLLLVLGERVDRWVHRDPPSGRGAPL